MITLGNINHFNRTLAFYGLSSDTKPIDKFQQDEVSAYSITNGSTFLEIDTGDEYMFDGASNTWNKMEGGGATGAINKEVVDALPTEDIDPNTMYLLRDVFGDDDNTYTEYMYVNNNWEALGPYVANVWLPGTGTGSAALARSGSVATGDMAVAEGNNTTAARRSQHVFGEYNISDAGGAGSTERGSYVEIAGNGTSSNRSNARTLDWNGNEWLAGTNSATDVMLPLGTGSERTSLKNKINAMQSDVEAVADDVEDYKDDLALLTGRVNEMTSLEEGSTTGDAELADIRVGADGTQYVNAGTAVREQISELKSALTEIYVLKQYAFFEPGYITANGTIGSTVSLTRHSNAGWESAVMACVPGDTFVVNIHGSNAARGWCFIDSNNVMLEKAVAGNRNETITAPENAAKVVFNNATDYPDKQVYKVSGTDRITPLYDVREPFAYFTSNAQPTFTLGDGSITVSKNGGNFRIYTNKGLLKTFTALGTHTITNVQKLVYDLDDDQIKVVAGTQGGNYILLLSFAGNNFNGILYPYYLKQQFKDVNSRIDSATDTAAEDFALSNVADGSDFKAVFFSDIHGASANMTSILSFANENTSRVDAILNGGDTAARWLNDTTYPLTWYTDAIQASSIDILSAIGNHDAWDGAYYTKASAVDVYNAFIAPLVAKYTGIVQPTGAAANGFCYYYKDYASKVRVVVINAMDQASCDYWDSAQATWFADVLTDAKTNDLAVICLEHAPYPLPISVRNAKADNWSTWYPLQTDGVKLETEAMDIVANFMASGGKFVCWLSGHLHEDNLLEATGYPGQFMVNIVTANAGRRNKVGVNTAASSPYFDGFNYIGVDTTNGLLKVYRKGWDMDAGMKKHDYLCYDFVNHQVIAN